MKNKYQKIKEWNENVSISWWRDGRIKLNKIIRKYNKWTEKHSDNIVKTAKLLARINKNLEMDYCNQSGGSGWKEELLNMRNIIKQHMKHN